MEIREIESQKRDFMELLLLADEQVNMIEKYLERGRLFAAFEGGKNVGVCVVTEEKPSIFEIKNIAVSPEYQKTGLGKALISHIEGHFKGCMKQLYVGTGDSPLTVPFYIKCGFKHSHRINRFILDNYDEPIFECGRQLIDMVYLKKEYQL